MGEWVAISNYSICRDRADA